MAETKRSSQIPPTPNIIRDPGDHAAIQRDLSRAELHSLQQAQIPLQTEVDDLQSKYADRLKDALTQADEIGRMERRLESITFEKDLAIITLRNNIEKLGETDLFDVNSISAITAEIQTHNASLKQLTASMDTLAISITQAKIVLLNTQTQVQALKQARAKKLAELEVSLQCANALVATIGRLKEESFHFQANKAIAGSKQVHLAQLALANNWMVPVQQPTSQQVLNTSVEYGEVPDRGRGRGQEYSPRDRPRRERSRSPRYNPESPRDRKRR